MAHEILQNELHLIDRALGTAQNIDLYRNCKHNFQQALAYASLGHTDTALERLTKVINDIMSLDTKNPHTYRIVCDRPRKRVTK